MGRATVLYDADCGFCRWSLRKILWWDRHRRLRPVALQSPEADRLLPDMDPQTRMGSWHLVDPNGRTHSAGDAVAPLLRLLPGGRPLARVAATFPGATRRAYRWVSSHREGLAKLVGSRACAIQPKDSSGPD